VKTKSKRRIFRLESDLDKQLSELAKSSDRDVSYIIRRCIENGLPQTALQLLPKE
jgi:predicted transcriptional regulator